MKTNRREFLKLTVGSAVLAAGGSVLAVQGPTIKYDDQLTDLMYNRNFAIVAECRETKDFVMIWLNKPYHKRPDVKRVAMRKVLEGINKKGLKLNNIDFYAHTIFEGWVEKIISGEITV